MFTLFSRIKGLKVMIFHGATRAKSSAKGIEELKSYDVILTRLVSAVWFSISLSPNLIGAVRSFGTLQSGYTKQEKGFKRGSQMIKENRSVVSSRMYASLNERHLICVSFGFS